MSTSTTAIQASSDAGGSRPLPDWGYIDGINVVDTRVGGAIGNFYNENGGFQRFGMPIENEWSWNGGRVQRFRKSDGTSTGIYWTAETGAHSINERGAFKAKWLSVGVRKLGFPIVDEHTITGGSKIIFKNGTVMYWSEATGAHSLNRWGAIYARWERDKHVFKYGYPLTDETTINKECAYATFRRNGYDTAIVWSQRFGTWTFNANGDFFNRWRKNIAKYGYPTTDERNLSGGRAEQRFSNGYRFYWDGFRTIESRI